MRGVGEAHGGATRRTQTGEVGDRRIFISELTHVVQIRSGKVDAAAEAL